MEITSVTLLRNNCPLGKDGGVGSVHQGGDKRFAWSARVQGGDKEASMVVTSSAEESSGSATTTVEKLIDISIPPAVAELHVEIKKLHIKTDLRDESGSHISTLYMGKTTSLKEGTQND
ncbi:hypothetical protein Tco_1343526 [Tanacetum coccineum]